MCNDFFGTEKNENRPIDLVRGGYAYRYVFSDGADCVEVYDADADLPICEQKPISIIPYVTPGKIKLMGQEEYEEFLYLWLSVK